MNNDRIVGIGRKQLGKAESSLGVSVGSDRLKGDSVVNQVASAVQHGFWSTARGWLVKLSAVRRV